MICPKCGYKIPSDLKECPVCGTHIHDPMHKEIRKKKIKITVQNSFFFLFQLVRSLIGVLIILFGLVGMSQNDLLFGGSIVLFGASLLPIFYKKTPYKFVAIVIPLQLFIIIFIIAVLTL